MEGNTGQQQKPTSTLRPEKRLSSNPDQDGSRKRRKAAQENQLLENAVSSQVDTDLIEDLPPPLARDTDRQSWFIERSRGVMEMCWTTRNRDGGSHSDGRDDDDEVEVVEDGGRDKDDEDKDEDKDKEDEDEDENEDEPSFMTLKYQVFPIGTCLVKTSSVKLQR